ncbi:TonB-dependent receptor [Cellvibrio fibrivorans]|uniref:Iron complex outermembrane receptor protein n=1 Tax=Cellvibrio fibrivorans TaxID=126350 RepID=A0ABU1V2M9_9GAMM|nr:TonB-dependent receptor [Cellvibrio fibrivorans]MDR7091627.1 iron complex outermembrane receptor protein [Cellvibrio fibrivorans]
MRNKLSDAIKLANKSALMLGSVAAVAMMGFVGTAHAQDAGAEPEEVLVTGIRGALKNAVDIKRNSTAVVDAVSAEDVGKFPDSDIGESLGRVPGVTVGRAFGQGASVSIRGAAPQMTLTQLNGQNVASTGWYDQQAIDRSFNYSLLPSQLVDGMEVYKSSRADLNEGGIGGTVVVKTRKPLDMEANTVYVGAKARTGTISDEISPEVSGLYSWKNDSESFGILVAGATEEFDYVRRGTEADYRWWDDVSPTTFIQERERTALDVTTQWAPTDELTFGLHYLSLDLKANNTNTSTYIFSGLDQSAANYTCSEKNAAGVCTVSTTKKPVRGNLTAGWASGALGTETFNQTWGRVASMDSETFDLNAEYAADSFKVTASAGSTKAGGGTDLTTNFSHFASLGDYNMALWAGSIDASGKKIKINATSDLNMTLANYRDKSAAEAWAVKRGPNSDEESYAQVDFEFDLDLGAIKSFKTGVRTTDHDVEKSSDAAVFGNATPQTLNDTSMFYRGTFEVGSHGFKAPKPVLGAMVKATLADVTGWKEERAGYAALNEQNDALYGMFTFEADAVKGDFGLRYISSDITGTSYALDGTPLAAGDLGQNLYYSTNKTSVGEDYDDVLPSLNVTFDLTDDLVLRTTASQAISRANYNDMFTNASQTGYQDGIPGNERLTTGNVGLKPMKASQADLGVEYYYGDGNMLSATYFVKSINNFVTSDIEINRSVGLVSPDSKVDNWEVVTLKNSGGGEIDGIELQLTHAFDNGFGMAASYTYVNANAPLESYTDRLGVFTESSKDSVNLVGYWENDVYSARAAYNWRSEYMIRETGYYGNRMHDDFGSLDLSLGWNVSDSISVSFEATNILEEDDVQYGGAEFWAADSGTKRPLLEGFPAWSFEGEATYMLGVSFKL